MGRHMVAESQEAGAEPGDELVAPPPGDRPEVYYDAIWFILQAAAYKGLDREEVCSDAIRMQRSIYQDALAGAARREHDDRPGGDGS